MSDSSETRQRVRSPTLRQYLQEYSQKKNKKGEAYAFPSKKTKNSSLSLALEKLQKLEKFI